MELTPCAESVKLNIGERKFTVPLYKCINAYALLSEAAKARGALMAFLPEGFDYIAETKDESSSLAEALDGATISAYRQIARDNCIALSLGGFHCKSDLGGKVIDGDSQLSQGDVFISIV